MTWAANRTTIVDGLPEGYVLIPANKEPEDSAMSHNHKAYSLKLKGTTDIDALSSNIYYYSHAVTMRVKYTHEDGTQLITNEGLAMTLMQTLTTLTGFHNFLAEPTIEDIDEKHIVFEIKFHFGEDDNE